MMFWIYRGIYAAKFQFRVPGAGRDLFQHQRIEEQVHQVIPTTHATYQYVPGTTG